jgi:hypothetical protein
MGNGSKYAGLGFLAVVGYLAVLFASACAWGWVLMLVLGALAHNGINVPAWGFWTCVPFGAVFTLIIGVFSRG